MQLTDDFTDDDIRLLESLKRFKKSANGMPPPAIERRNEMTDRELLEAAAKTAGLEVLPASKNRDAWPRLASGGWWNPLKDNADAFRLVVQLRLSLELRISGAMVRWRDAAGSEWFLHQFVEDMAPEEYTRRAIVRAAAELAQAVGCMPNAQAHRPDPAR